MNSNTNKAYVYISLKTCLRILVSSAANPKLDSLVIKEQARQAACTMTGVPKFVLKLW